MSRLFLLIIYLSLVQAKSDGGDRFRHENEDVNFRKDNILQYFKRNDEERLNEAFQGTRSLMDQPGAQGKIQHVLKTPSTATVRSASTS